MFIRYHTRKKWFVTKSILKEIEGQKATALFDTGTLNSYVSRYLLKEVPMQTFPKPFTVALGGKTEESDSEWRLFADAQSDRRTF